MSQPSTTSSNPQEQAGAGSVWNPGYVKSGKRIISSSTCP